MSEAVPFGAAAEAAADPVVAAGEGLGAFAAGSGAGPGLLGAAA